MDSGLTPLARFCSLDSHARQRTVSSPLDDFIPSNPVSHLTLWSTTVPMIPPVQGTCVGTVRFLGVPSGFFPRMCASMCCALNSSVNLPRWP